MIDQDVKARVTQYLEESVLPNTDLVDSFTFKGTGLKAFSHNGVGVLLCPFCSNETAYFANTSATRCQRCGTVSLAAAITEHAKSIFTIKNLAKECGVDFDFRDFQSKKFLSLAKVKGFLNAQLPVSFSAGMSNIGWSESVQQNALIGSVGDDAEHMWERFVGEDYMDVYQRFCHFKGYLCMPFYDGNRVNAVLLSPDFQQGGIWHEVNYQFLYEPKFSHVWYKRATKDSESNVIAVSNPLYAVYLLAQGKPAIFVHDHADTPSKLDMNNVFVFEDDIKSQEILGDDVVKIENSSLDLDCSIWTNLKNIDVNSSFNRWINDLEIILKNSSSLSDAIKTYQNEKSAIILVRPVQV